MTACQVKKATTKEITLEGYLYQRVWSKTEQSYCAGGSDYYVIQDRQKKEHILQFKEKGAAMKSLLTVLQGKWVRATGNFREKEIVPPSDGVTSQHPVTTTPDGKQDNTFKCIVFDCKTIME